MTLWPSNPIPACPPAWGPNPDLLARLTADLTLLQARHVAILTPDGITANSAQLHAGLRFHRFHPISGQPVTATGSGGLGGLVEGLLRGIAGATNQQTGIQVQCKDEQSGPYRRVYSRPGYAYQYSRVYLPSDQHGDLKEEKGAGSGDTAFVYLGGWGRGGGAVDAGFQHGRYMNGSQDDWAPFFLVQQIGGPSAITVSNERQAGGDPWRLLAGQDAEVTFWVTQNDDLTTLNMFVHGTTNRDRQDATLTIRAPIDHRFGWDARGGANILKRMTTIGQTQGKQNLQTGSYLQGVNWQGSRIGLNDQQWEPWDAQHTGGYCTFPDPHAPEGQQANGRGPKWRIDYRDPGSETDSVYLS